VRDIVLVPRASLFALRPIGLATPRPAAGEGRLEAGDNLDGSA